MIKNLLIFITFLLIFKNCITTNSGIREIQTSGKYDTEIFNSLLKSKKTFLEKIDSSTDETKTQARIDYAVFLESMNQFDDDQRNQKGVL